MLTGLNNITKKPPELRCAILGLGYVGLPLAVALSKHIHVTGFDINPIRIEALKQNNDSTGEVNSQKLLEAGISFTCDAAKLAEHDIFIVTVPTPINNDNTPDLSLVLSAMDLIASALRPGTIVVLESTVYPGVTEDVCGKHLECLTGLKSGIDFYLGYSPERMNPGDKQHSVETIVKVVAGQTPEVTEVLANLYGMLNNNQIHKASSIRVAEAAKVIENAQRDINIAFINEISMIFQKMGIAVTEVLEAASTKWNFLPFRPGFVGGHCIGVDPYYLAYCAQSYGYIPEVILSGRRVNETMAYFIADRVHDYLGKIGKRGNAKICILGATFKENVPDIRNSKSFDLYKRLNWLGHEVQMYDPLANPAEAKHEYDIELLSSINGTKFDCVIAAVAHDQFIQIAESTLNAQLNLPGLVVDIKNIWPQHNLPDGVQYWRP